MADWAGPRADIKIDWSSPRIKPALEDEFGNPIKELAAKDIKKAREAARDAELARQMEQLERQNQVSLQQLYAKEPEPEIEVLNPDNKRSMTDEELELYDGMINIVQYGRSKAITSTRMIGVLQHLIKLLTKEKI